MSKFAAIIYDVDGTLINSEPLHVKAWDETLKKHNHSLADLPQTFLRTMAGKKPIAIAEGMIDELHLPTDPSSFLQAKTDLFRTYADTELEAMPGAIESVHMFHSSGYKLGIGTSLDRTFVYQILAKFSIQNEFTAIVTGDQVKHGKPDPATYLQVAKALSVNPHECLVFEDAQSGVESAKAAGMYCIGVENPFAEPQDLSQADKIVTSLGEARDLLY